MNTVTLAWRQLWRSPGFSLMAIGTLALGIGGTTAIFSVYNAVVLQPLPFDRPEQLVQILKTSPWQPPLPFLRRDDVRAWEQANPVLEAVGAYSRDEANWSGAGEAARVSVVRVSASFLPMLGVKPVFGRTISPEDDGPGGAAVALLSHRVWRRQFAGARDVLGKTIELDNSPHTVIGVLPSELNYPGEFDVLTPLRLSATPVDRRAQAALSMPEAIGRLRPGVTLEQAQTGLDAVYQAVKSPEDKDRIVAQSLRDRLVGVQDANLRWLLMAVGMVLLIACVNVASLLVVRGAARQKETAVQAALGASRGRIARQSLAESLLLSALGGIAGVPLAYWGLWLLQPLIAFLPQTRPAQLDLWTLGFALLLALLAGSLSGLAPALGAARASLQTVLNESNPGIGRGRSSLRAQNLFVTVEIASAFLLLLVSSLTILSVWRAGSFDPGFRAERLLTFSIHPSAARYADAAARAAYVERVREAIAALPGVSGVALGSAMPFQQGGSLFLEGPDGQAQALPIAWVNDDYFKTLGLPLARGRAFGREDRAGTAPVAVVNECFLSKWAPKGDALGQPLPQFHGQPPVVVGVCGNLKHGPGIDPTPLVYLPLAQQLEPAGGPVRFAVRTQGAPWRAIEAVRRVVATVDPTQPLYEVKSMEQRWADTVAFEWSMNRVFAAFSIVAMGLSALGIYGVVAYAVTRRTRELGVRVALGARRGQVLLLVMGQGLRLAAAGAAAGAVLGLGFAAFVITEFYGMPALNAPVFLGTAGAVALLTVLAGLPPALRAMRIDPARALAQP